MRLPRTLAGLLAGAALGLAGAVVQGLTRNPLADPGLLGVNAGAAVFVVLAISVLSLTEPSQYIWFGFLGATLAALLVHGVAGIGREGATPVKPALAGAVLAHALGQRLNGLALDDVARGLGQRLGVTRALGAVGVVLLCGAATAVAGPLGFVGLAVPHAARLITGPDHRWILPYSTLLAPILLLLADVVGRVAARPGEIQVGVVTAPIGCVPFVLLVQVSEENLQMLDAGLSQAFATNSVLSMGYAVDHVVLLFAAALK